MKKRKKLGTEWENQRKLGNFDNRSGVWFEDGQDGERRDNDYDKVENAAEIFENAGENEVLQTFENIKASFNKDENTKQAKDSLKIPKFTKKSLSKVSKKNRHKVVDNGGTGIKEKINSHDLDIYHRGTAQVQNSNFQEDGLIKTLVTCVDNQVNSQILEEAKNVDYCSYEVFTPSIQAEHFEGHHDESDKLDNIMIQQRIEEQQRRQREQQRQAALKQLHEDDSDWSSSDLQDDYVSNDSFEALSDDDIKATTNEEKAKIDICQKSPVIDE